MHIFSARSVITSEAGASSMFPSRFQRNLIESLSPRHAL